MKVLIVNKFLYPNGGSETYIFEIGKQLEKLGHEVQFFGMEHKGRIVGNRSEAYTSDMDFHTGKMGKLLYPFKIIYSKEAKKQIRKVLDQMQPDVVHLNNINFQITPSIIDEIISYRKKTGRNVKIVSTAHDYQWICPNHMMRIPQTDHNCDKCIGGRYINCTKNKCIHGSTLKSMLGVIEARLYRMKKTYSRVDTIICPSVFLCDQFKKDEILNRCNLVAKHNFFLKGDDFESFHSTCIIYNAGLKEKIEVDTPCCNVDILPTVYNLFGIRYDSRLYAGTDVFGNGLHIAQLYNKNFITENVKYNFGSGEATWLIDTSKYSEMLLDNYLSNAINTVKNRYAYSIGVEDTDLFACIFENYDVEAALRAERADTMKVEVSSEE